jgi:hypothetical protein
VIEALRPQLGPALRTLGIQAVVLSLSASALAQEPVDAPPVAPPPAPAAAQPVPPEPAPPPPSVTPPPLVPTSHPALPTLLPTASNWNVQWGGYVHAAYRWIEEPQNYALAGRNNGFQLEQARLMLNVQWKWVLAARVSVDGATEDRLTQSFPGGQLTTRLRDAWIIWSPLRALRISIGQQVTPWDLDSLRSDAELPFVTRSVAVEGVQPSEGFTTRGLGSDRNIGISIHSGFIGLGGNTSLRYSVFAGNGNGQNQILNDNNIPAIFGRFEFAYWGAQGLPADRVAPIYSVTDDFHKPIINIAVAGQWNPRTVGDLPDLMRETDAGAAADIAAFWHGVEVQGGVIYLKTSRDTLTAVPDLERFGWWAHARYTLPRIPVAITAGYRIGSYSPRAHLRTAPELQSDRDFDASFDLMYHTVGVRVRPTRRFPMHFGANYTFTGEQGANVLNNDRFEADVVAIF